jgi:putative FmdB family regulatory protein
MPTYDYQCTACGHGWEMVQPMSASPVKACPECGKKTAKRLIGAGAALLFKGSGFYQTDYRTESYKKGAEAEGKQSSGGEKASGDAAASSKSSTESGAAAKTASEPAKAATSEAKPAANVTEKPAASKAVKGKPKDK